MDLGCAGWAPWRLRAGGRRAIAGGVGGQAKIWNRKFCEIAQRPSQRKDGHRSRRTWFLRNCATTPASAGAGSSRRARHGRGHDAGKDGHRSRQTWFCEIAQRPRPPPWQALLAGFDPGRGTTRRKDGHRSRRTRFLRNCATTLPPGQAPLAGFDPGRGTTRGKTGTGRGGRGFCEIAQQPPPAGAGSSRRVRPGPGHDPGKDGHRSRRTWFLRNCATTLPPGQAPLAGLDTGRGTTRGKTGTGRGGRGFCEIAQQPSRRGRLLPPGSARTGARPEEGRAQVAADVVFCEIAQRPSRRGRLLSPGSTRAGFREMRNDPRGRCERVCPWVRCPEGARDATATVRHWPGGGNERVGSLGPRTLTRVATRPDLSRTRER